MLQGFYCWGVHQCFRVFADFIMKSTIVFAIFWHKQAHLGMRGTPSKEKETGEITISSRANRITSMRQLINARESNRNRIVIEVELIVGAADL